MNIEGAIKVLEEERSDHHSFPTDIIGQAEQLGIEALKRVTYQRRDHLSRYSELLPSETED